jgi:mannose-6-phosphate isomerase-like protein (cupin superfamily)
VIATSEGNAAAEHETLTMPDGMSFTIVHSTGIDPDEVCELEISIPPGSASPPRHLHPQQEERWETLSGTLSIWLDGGWRPLREGESVTIPPGVPHTLRNDSAATVRVRDVHVPALDFEDYIRRLHALAVAGKITSPRRPSTLLHFAQLWQNQRSQVPAQTPVRVALAVLARIGRLLGYRV